MILRPRVNQFALITCFMWLYTAGLLLAQNPPTLSGTITDTFGKPRSNVDITIKNTSTGQTTDAQSDTAGHYSIANLPPGDYEVTASADGFSAATSKVTITAGTPATVNLSLLPAADQSQQNLPNAPSPNKTEPSLDDLGFSKTETQSNAAQQALLDKRTHMLKIHQRMGLITTIPLVATVILGPGAGGKSEGTATRDLHVALGALTGDLYGITAWYAIRAPRIKGTPKRGPIRFHEAMAWIHGPGMILTPILGAMAFEQKNNGQRVHGIAQAHGPVAIITAGAFGAALLSVSVKF
jgi:hypothetical protein